MNSKHVYADVKKCTGCRICELTCSFFFEQVINPKKARIRVMRREPGIDYPLVCRHCKEPACLKACPVEAIKQVNGKVVIDFKKCTGCRICIEACPYDAMFFNADKNVAINCTVCGTCVKQCPVQCLKIVEKNK